MKPAKSISRFKTWAVLAVSGIACGTTNVTDPGSTSPTMRIAIARFQHETTTFNPGGDTDIERWTRIRPPYKGDEIFTADEYIRGFVARSREYGNVELIGLESPAEVFGSSSASWNTREAFEHFTGLIITDLRRHMPVDGVYLALHGAMAVREILRPEAEIARRVREVVGLEVPIVATFDLHGNEDQEFLRSADMAFVTKRYPHYDAYLQGEQAARMLIRTIRGEFKPTTATRKPGIISATVVQWTGQSPSMDIMERARRWEDRKRDAYVSVFYGFPWSDVQDVGATIMVVTNNDQQLAEQIAQDMSEYMWRVRKEFVSGDFPLPADAALRIQQAVRDGRIPVAVGDYSDRNGDATHILSAFTSAGLSKVLYGTIRDENVLAELARRNAKAEEPFAMNVGGFASEASGRPVQIQGTLKYFGPAWDYQQVAAVAFGTGNLVFITPAYTQIISPEALKVGPVDPAGYDIFVVKSRVHFRRGFDETGYAKSIFIVDAPGDFVGTTRLKALTYQFARINELYPYCEPNCQAP